MSPFCVGPWPLTQEAFSRALWPRPALSLLSMGAWNGGGALSPAGHLLAGQGWCEHGSPALGAQPFLQHQRCALRAWQPCCPLPGRRTGAVPCPKDAGRSHPGRQFFGSPRSRPCGWWHCAEQVHVGLAGDGQRDDLPGRVPGALGLGAASGRPRRPSARAAGGRPRAVPAKARAAPGALRRHTLGSRGGDTSGGSSGPGGRNAEPARGLRRPRMAQGRRRAACVGP